MSTNPTPVRSSATTYRWIRQFHLWIGAWGALAAILFVVAYNMSELKHFKRMVQRAPRADVAILLITALSVARERGDRADELRHRRDRSLILLGFWRGFRGDEENARVALFSLDPQSAKLTALGSVAAGQGGQAALQQREAMVVFLQAAARVGLVEPAQ